jgi:fumarylacetoacetate (FAA) hydrolase
MKLVSYKSKKTDRVGILFEDKVYDLQKSAASLKVKLPSTMKEFLDDESGAMKKALTVNSAIKKGKVKGGMKYSDLEILSPVPYPTSLRDGYAFRQHVFTARRNRGVEMIPEFDQFPVFYFGNHQTVFGEGIIKVEDDHLKGLDFELECAVVIGKKGKNISSSKADEFIAGYMIMNDFSARVLQMDEMKLSLGPAKGKDFATTLGPVLVTRDELKKHRIKTEFGEKYDLEMIARHNGKEISRGNLNQMDWTFAEIVERASYGVTLYPGDVIGSGTVGTGCYLELNGTWAIIAKEKGLEHKPVWLKDSDEIELEITGLGVLKNKIKKSKTSRSIIAKKKNLKR